MSTDGAIEVPRWNPWREWRPLIANMPLAEWARFNADLRDLPDPSVRAVTAYTRITATQAIEFVFLANFADPTTPQQYPSGITAVPCEDVLAAARSEFVGPPPRNEHIYDAVMPLDGTDPSAIAAALVRIDESLGAISQAWGVSIRWIPKYIEAVDPNGVRQRKLGAEDLRRARPSRCRPRAGAAGAPRSRRARDPLDGARAARARRDRSFPLLVVRLRRPRPRALRSRR